MIPARLPIQRPAGARLLVAGRTARLEHWRRADFVRLFRDGDLVIANDAATLPASLTGQHVPQRSRSRSAAGRARLARAGHPVLGRAVRRW